MRIANLLTLLLTGTSLVLAPTALPTASALGGPPCTITGTDGDDVLVGTRARDVICGGAGNDVIRGRGGKDLVHGGPGDDVVRGGRGTDWLYAGPGADRTFGGLGSDTIRGGPGQDTADVGAGKRDRVFDPDDQLCDDTWPRLPANCRWWKPVPKVGKIRVGETVVDVSAGQDVVQIRARIRDLDGVRRATVHASGGYEYDAIIGAVLKASMRRVSGTPQDGQWVGDLAVPRGFPTAALDVLIEANNRWRNNSSWIVEGLSVVDANPDQEYPGVTLLSPSTAQTFDVRTTSVVVPVQMRLRDSDTGVNDRVRFCADRTRDDEGPEPLSCARAKQISGDEHDGVWAADVTVPQGAITGDLEFAAFATDRARPLIDARAMGLTGWLASYWHYDDDYGPGIWDPNPRAIIDGNVRHHILGKRAKRVAAQITAFTLATSPVTVPAAGDQPTIRHTLSFVDDTHVSQAFIKMVPADGSSQSGDDYIQLSRLGDEWIADQFISGQQPGTYRPLLTVFQDGYTRTYGSAALATQLGYPLDPLTGDPTLVFEPE